MNNFNPELEFQKNNTIRSIIGHLKNYQETENSKFLMIAAEQLKKLIETDKLLKGGNNECR